MSLTLSSVGGAKTIPLVTHVTFSHENVRLGSDEPAGAADDSDVPAAAMLQSRPCGSALGSRRSSAQVMAGLPARGPWPELTVADGSGSGSGVHVAPELLCPRWYTQAVKPCYGSGESSRIDWPCELSS